MKKEILISSTLNETRIAITEQGELAELFVEVPDKERYVGNVYMGRVEKIIQGMNAAFVDIGLNQGAFLHFSDVDSSLEESFSTDDEDEDEIPKQHAKHIEKPDKGFIRMDFAPPHGVHIPPSDIIEADIQEMIAEMLDKPTVGKPLGFKAFIESMKVSQIAPVIEEKPAISDSAAIALRIKKMPEKQGNAKPLPTFSTKRSGTISINLQPKQTIIVQVVREGYSSKGVRVTTKIGLPGRYMVLLPFEQLVGVSKKIPSLKERKRLRSIAKGFVPEGIGCIIRTAAEDRSDIELQRDWALLMEQWREMEANVMKAKAPSLLYRDKSLAGSVIRDLFSEDVQRVVFDSMHQHKETMNYLGIADPDLQAKIALYQGKKPLFDYFGIEKSIRETYERTVKLPNGGSIVIDQTEALHVIDVNSGRSSAGEAEQEKIAFKTNMEALKVAARQLRLRDIGGMIIIDFIDMQLEENRKKIYNEMKRELSRDRAKTVVYPITQLGLLQITRQRIRQAISERLSDTCPTCDGAGRIHSRSLIFQEIEHWIRLFRAQQLDFGIELHVHPDMAAYLTKGPISRLSKLMIKYLIRIRIHIDERLTPDDFRFYSMKTFTDITADYLL
jgi:ribonuclease G